MTSKFYPTDQTLAAGHRLTRITITTAPTSLDALLNAAVAGRASIPGRRVLQITNLDGSASFFLLSDPSQTPSQMRPVAAGTTYTAEASESFTANIAEYVAQGLGFYLATSSGTVAAIVTESR